MARTHLRLGTWSLGLALLLVSGGALACLDDWTPDDDTVQPPGPGGEPSFGPVAGALQSPVRLALTPEGAVLVTDSRLGIVAEVDPTSLAAVAGAAITGKPLAVGFLDGRIYVGNAAARTVDVLDALGSPVTSFGRGAVGHPSDLAVDAALGQLFVVDGVARAVKVFDRNGRLLRTLGSGATFQAPIGVAVDTARREVLVTDYGNPDASLAAAVKIFDYDGNFLAEISGKGTCGSLGCSGGFSRPQGLAVHGGRIYMADGLLAAVLVFDRATLARDTVLGGRGVPPNLRMPSDVAIGANGDVYVVSNVAGHVEVFRQAAAR